MKGLLAGVAVFAVAFAIVVLVGGEGHGSYIAAKILFPYYILIVGGLRGAMVIQSFAMIVSIIQFPLYGYAVQKSSKFAIAALCIHIAAFLACIRLNPATFSP
jgi:hypothetical protein